MTPMRSTQLRFTSPTRRSRRRVRGTAEVELMLSIVVLLAILLMCWSAARLAIGRMGVEQTAKYEAFHNAIQGAEPQYVDDPDEPLVEGYVNIRPGFPNRMHVPRPTKEVGVMTGGSRYPVTLGGNAAVPSPAWTYTGQPVGIDDQSLHSEWYQNYAEEAKLPELVSPLGLAPVWPP